MPGMRSQLCSLGGPAAATLDLHLCTVCAPGGRRARGSRALNSSRAAKATAVAATSTVDAEDAARWPCSHTHHNSVACHGAPQGCHAGAVTSEPANAMYWDAHLDAGGRVLAHREERRVAGAQVGAHAVRPVQHARGQAAGARGARAGGRVRARVRALVVHRQALAPGVPMSARDAVSICADGGSAPVAQRSHPAWARAGRHLHRQRVHRARGDLERLAPLWPRRLAPDHLRARRPVDRPL